MTVRSDTPALSVHRREQLVRQIIEAPATEQEWSWREWKGRVDIRTFAPTIAKHILGFANRPISSAQTYADGWAYLVLGAGPQQLEGVEVIDSADLQKWIGPFIGPRGPQWDPHYVTVNDLPVLVIAVAPRRPTDPIFRVRRSGRDINDGDVFIRAGSETRRARADEQDLLDAERAPTTLQLDVRVSVTGGPLTAVDLSDQARDAWVKSESARLLAPLESNIAPRDDGYRSIAITEESRTPDEYRAAVAAYLDATRAVWVPRVAASAIQARVAEFHVRVENATPQNFPDVEVAVSFLSGIVWAWSEEHIDDVALPKPPHLWGTRAPFTRAGLGLPPLSNTIPFAHLAGGDQIEPGGVPIVYEAFHLRPYGVQALPPVLLAIDGRLTDSEGDADWTLTSTSVTGIAKGTMHVAVASDALPAALLLERG